MTPRKFLIEVHDDGQWEVVEITTRNGGRTIPNDVIATVVQHDAGCSLGLRPMRAAAWGAHSALEEVINEIVQE